MNNVYLIKSRSSLIALYNDEAILEKHHSFRAFELMLSRYKGQGGRRGGDSDSEGASERSTTPHSPPSSCSSVERGGIVVPRL